MSFEVQPAQPADASRLADVFFASFDDEFNRTMFPPAPDTHDWFSNNFFSDAIAQHFTGDGHVTVLKVVEASNPTEIAAFAIWRRYMTSADRDRREESHNSDMQLPASSDKALCEHFFGAMEEEHQKWMGDRPHYCMFSVLIFFPTPTSPASIPTPFLVRGNTGYSWCAVCTTTDVNCRSRYSRHPRFVPGPWVRVETVTLGPGARG